MIESLSNILLQWRLARSDASGTTGFTSAIPPLTVHAEEACTIPPCCTEDVVDELDEFIAVDALSDVIVNSLMHTRKVDADALLGTIYIRE